MMGGVSPLCHLVGADAPAAAVNYVLMESFLACRDSLSPNRLPGIPSCTPVLEAAPEVSKYCKQLSSPASATHAEGRSSKTQFPPNSDASPYS